MSQVPPDFAAHGYVASALLGRNVSAGRSTWRATRSSDGEAVVIKRFSFAAADASWDAFRDHEREIAVLRELDHPGIPRFLDAFQTADGFCLVQSFVAGRPLGERVSFTLPEVLDLARKVLELLDYLQTRVPPVIHRDLKPDNILRDERGRVWLVDFGLARTQHDTTSTLAVGTPGFMPPEQLLGRALGPASDLYGLGATLIACLTGRRGAALGDLVDASFRFDLARLPALPAPLHRWLARLVEPEVSRRFRSASVALAALAESERERAAPPRAPEDDALGAPDADTPFELQPGTWPHAGRRAQPRSTGPIGLIGLLTLGVVGTSALLAHQEEEQARRASVMARSAADMQADSERVIADMVSRALADDPRAGDPLAEGAPEPLPKRCTSALTVSDVSLAVPPGADPYVAAAGCDLTLEDARVRADGTAFEVQRGARVRIVASRLESVQAAPLVTVSGDGELELTETTLKGGRGLALKVREGTVTVRRGRLASGGPAAIDVSSDGLLVVEDAEIDGEITGQRGHVLGLDPARDAEVRKALRDGHYEAGACDGIRECLSGSGYFGTVELQVVGRLTRGVVDRVRVIDATNGRVDRALRACLETAGAATPAPTSPPRGGGGAAPADLPLAYRGCSVTGQVNGGSQMLSFSGLFFVADESPENAKKMRRVFR
jgi:serine/threonine protein kinase